jgi:hypothetical protein
MSNVEGGGGTIFRHIIFGLGLGVLLLAVCSHAEEVPAQRQEAAAWAVVQREGFGPAVGVTQPIGGSAESAEACPGGCDDVIGGGDYEKAEAADGEDPHTAARERPQGSK